MATKSTPDGVDLKLSNYSTTAAMNGSIASANNATLATVAANYGLKTVVDQHSLDIAPTLSWGPSPPRRWPPSSRAKTPPSRACRPPRQTALLDAVTTAALDSALLGKADASALASLLCTVDGLDTPLEVDTKIANALLGLATKAFVAAQLASRDASITALQGAKADATLLASYATNAALSASETTLQSALSFPAAAELLTRRPGRASEHERLRGPGQVRAGRGQELRDELRAPDQRLGGVPGLCGDAQDGPQQGLHERPTQVGARTLQLSKLMMEKAYYLHMRRLFPKMRLLFTDTDSVMVQIFELQDMAEANLNGAALFRQVKDRERDLSALSAAARSKAIKVMGQLGKLGDETFPARILEYVGLRSKMYSILTVQPDGARKEKRKIKGVPKKAVTNVRHLEYREVLEEGSERRAAFAQLRSRAHEIAVETVEKKSLSPFNDKVYGLDAHNLRPLGHWRNLGARSDTAAAAEPLLGVDCRNRKKRSQALVFSLSR